MLEVFIATRYLFTHRKERFISIINVFALIGTALGVATLIIVMSVMNGYETELINKILGIKGHITVVSKEKYKAASEYNNVVDTLEKVRTVDVAAPIIEAQVMISSEHGSTGSIVKGMQLQNVMSRSSIKSSLIEGEWEDFQNDTIFIGKGMSYRLNIGIGDKVKLIAPSSTNILLEGIPRIKIFTLGGIFDLGMHEYNNSIIFMPLESAQSFFQMPGNISYIEVNIQGLQRFQATEREINEVLGDGFYTINWEQANQSLHSALKVEQNVMFLILSLIIMIAVFNISSSLIILVKEKSKSIAILRTMGASRGSVASIFILCGLSIGIVGTALGATIGVAFVVNIETIRVYLEKFIGITIFDPVVYFLTTLPAKIDVTQTVVIILMSVFLTLLATIYPALKIASLSPIKALRYE